MLHSVKADQAKNVDFGYRVSRVSRYHGSLPKNKRPFSRKLKKHSVYLVYAHFLTSALFCTLKAIARRKEGRARTSLEI